ncbi:MAG TPA: HEAT repeat domain-containing protein [Myxococcales bacterium]|nr:HEAT repeat domain-containing protein [Myxococcales bacterium]
MGTTDIEKTFQSGSNDAEIIAALQESQPGLRERAIALAARHLPPEMLGRFVGNDENAVLRNSALSALERQGPYAVPHLVALSRGENMEVAMFAVQILSRIKDPASAHSLLPLLEHADSNISQAAIEALGALKAREAVPGLIRLLAADLWLQFAAVAALGEIGDPRAVPALLDAIPNEMLAEPAVDALGRIGAPEALPRLLSHLADHDRLPLRDQLLKACAAILEHHPASPSVFTRFRRKLDEERREPALLDYLGALLASDDAVLGRAAGAVTLAAQLDKLYPLVVQRALSAEAEEARWTAALCRKYERAVRAALGDLLRNPDPHVRCGALLCAPADPPSVSVIVPLMQDPDADVRAAACHALGRCRDVAAIPALVERFGRGTPPESTAAAEALGSMPGQSLVALAQFLEEEGKVLPALEILESARSPLFPDKILELLEASSAPVRRAALRVLVNHDEVDAEEHLVRKLQDGDESVRIEAVELLVRNGSTRAVPALVGLLFVSDDLRYHVIRALGRLRAESAAAELERLFPRAGGHERLEIVAALIRIGSPGLLPFLKARLHDAEPEVRRVAADGLARVAQPAELPLLVQLAQDPDWSIRNHAGWGLGRLGLAKGREALLALVRDTEPVVARTARAALAKLQG